MSLLDKLELGINTTVIGMGIVFLVLIALQYIIILQSKLFSTIGKNKKEPREAFKCVPKPQIALDKAIAAGAKNDEEVVVIITAISEEAQIPFGELKIKSIKSI